LLPTQPSKSSRSAATLPGVLILALGLAAPALAQAPPATGAKPPTAASPATRPPSSAAGGSAQRLDGIAAVVNNEAVLQSDVEEQLYLFLSRAQTEVDSSAVDTLRTQILNQLIDDKLIVAEATKQGVTVTDAEVNKMAQDNLRDTKARFPSTEAYLDELHKQNMTEAQLLDKMKGESRRQLLANRLIQRHVPHRQVAQAEAETYFNAHKDKFPKAPAEVRLSVIQIPATADSSVDNQVKSQALAVRKRIAGGEKFAKVAAEVSDDDSSKRSGGDLGYMTTGTMDPAFEKAVFTLKLNTLSQPVRTIYGWHILEVIDRDTLKTTAGRDSLTPDKKPVLEAHIRHVLLRVPVSDDDVARARDLAANVRAQAMAGKDFAELARHYSKYVGPHSEDGDIGFLPMSSLQPNIRAGVDSVQVGGVTQVLINQSGFNIFKVTERRAEREYALDEVRDELPGVVSEMIFREKLEEWVKTLRAKAQIKINKS
jgi:peptidyl-prolyl cis-trans isomerase SurA